MYLSGSIDEIKKIIMVAEDLRADAIHFIAPNIVFILAKNKEDYVYLKASITVGQSMLVPKSSFQTMHIYLKSVKRGFHLKDSPFYMELISSVTFLSGHIRFNDSDRLKIEVTIRTFPLKKEVEFKVKETINVSFDTNAPYLRISYENLQLMHKDMMKYKKRYESVNSTDNAIRIEGDQLVLYFTYKEQRSRLETGIQAFGLNDEYPDINYFFSDKALYLIKWLMRIRKCENVMFIPRDGYSIVEGYLSNMVVKVRTTLKNDLVLKKV